MFNFGPYFAGDGQQHDSPPVVAGKKVPFLWQLHQVSSLSVFWHSLMFSDLAKEWE
jgi:hypothetical protein